MKLREILFLILIGVLLAASGYLVYRVVSLSSDRKLLLSEINALHNAPAIVDTVHDSVLIRGRTIIIPKPVKVTVYDTVYVQKKTTWYDSTFSKDGIRFRWAARATGEIDTLSFSDFVFPKEVITITKHYDTCFLKPPEYKAKFLHYGLYTEMMVQNFTDFPGIGLGGQVILKDMVTISLGGVYCSGLYGNLRIGVLLK